MRFKYKVIDEQMSVAEGTLEAADYEAARRMIQENGWQVISLLEPRGLNALLNKRIMTKVKYESISAFCSQLAMMVRSGANLVRGLEVLKLQLEDKELQEVLEIIVRGVSRGDSLSQAMRDCRGALPDLLINLVAVGEESGNLESVLTSMAEYYDRENYIRKKVQSASIYPVILLTVLIGIIFFFMNFLLPEITGMLTESGQSLPLPTRMIINTADFFSNYGIYLLAGLIGLVFGLNWLFKIPKYRYYRDALMLGMPILGINIKNIVISRFSRTFALFLHSSIPMVPILNSMETIVGNEVSRTGIARIRERIIKGEPLTQAFGQEKFFDPLVVQMISIGEETGRLEEMLEEVADLYDKKVELGIARMISLVEPVFTVIIGIFAGGMIIAIALPIFSMATGTQ
ncbi:type IV pilus assembly protein PilC [Desulfitobacterium sp. LBE]|uniref:Type II secretion system protein n=1 Tax=Desulfitobacterium hafniense (strain DSM 10664 / DCB-2) TaxID=272564 RepID=B8FQB1_DESHD|nr:MULTISPECIES: type II secretion system F family protein [Desulfitobacterium]ACL21572.1 type II secretion system protein [Desulfitobacterium hafniense DCB-2]TWH60638.1 type IV pilus assembly protein PilC [Desulfitobacterium sp. LBE]